MRTLNYILVKNCNCTLEEKPRVFSDEVAAVETKELNSTNKIYYTDKKATIFSSFVETKEGFIIIQVFHGPAV